MSACPLRAICVINAMQQISTGLRGYLGLWSAGGTPGQAHRKHRALARLARHGDVAPHHARELARESKPEPRPAVAAGGQGICLREVLEQFRLLRSEQNRSLGGARQPELAGHKARDL